MTSAAAPFGVTVRTRQSEEETLLRRFVGVAAFLAVPVALSLLAADGATHAFAAAIGGYSPDDLAHGAVWTLVGGAFLLPHVAMIGPTTVAAGACFLPYALSRGVVRAAATYVVGHVVATLAVGVVVIAGFVAGWGALGHAYRSIDVGASEGLAAIVGALAVVLFRRSRVVGVLVLVGASAFLLRGVLGEGTVHLQSATEHMVALGVGVAIEATPGPIRRWTGRERADRP